MPGHQEVHVLVARCLDRAAEHVHEQQHEHHRLDRERDPQVGLARDAQQVASWRPRRCRRRRRRASSCRLLAPRVSSTRPGSSPSSPVWSGSAAWPVSVMNTSSSVGRRTAMSSMPDAGGVEPAHRLGDRAAAAAEAAARGSRPRTWGARPRAGRAPRSQSPVDEPACERHLEPLAADAVLQLVRGALDAITWPWSITAIESARRSASSRY